MHLNNNPVFPLNKEIWTNEIAGNNAILLNPLFVSAARNDYHLQAQSPAIGRALGIDPVGATDADHLPRDFSRRGDLGALFYRPRS